MAGAMTTSIYLEKRIPARNQKRFYTITVTRTLFDGWTVIREWGRIGQPGTVRETWFETEREAIEAGMKVRQRKVKRGYRHTLAPCCFLEEMPNFPTADAGGSTKDR